MTTPFQAQRVVLASRPQGEPTPSDFRLEDFILPTTGQDEVLVKTRLLSLDPYMRGRMNDAKSYAEPIALGQVMVGEGIAEVLESRRPGLARGDVVRAPTGWSTHAVLPGRRLEKIDPGGAPLSAHLGVLGMPGFTAYSGLVEIGRPEAGETVVVAAASGPVGSLVGQLARMAGARAVGVAGGADKCAFVRDVLGFDAAVDHRSADFPAALAQACPDGVDVYFENVGGAVWSAVLPLLNPFGRVPVCGLIADYNGDAIAPSQDRLPGLMRAILSKSLKVQGFINYDFGQHRQAFLREVGAGLVSGAIKYREDMVEGLAAAPEAFLGMLKGRNFGKVVVRVNS